MKTELSEKLLRRFLGLRHSRGTWDAHWRDVAQYVYPEKDDFWRSWNQTAHGARRNQRIYDSTAPHANGQFAAVLESLLIPSQSKWHQLRATDPALNRVRPVQLWFDSVNSILFEKRYSPRANFQGQMNEAFMSIGAFGTAAIFIDERAGEGLRYKNCFIGDTYIDISHQGLVNQVYRRFDFSNQQAVERWGLENVPKMVRTEYEANRPDERHEYVHIVLPNEQIDVRRSDERGMPFTSIYIDCDEGNELERGGYMSFPYAVSRWMTSSLEMYGRSPAMQVLPDIRTLNEMAKTQLSALHKAVNPPLLLHDDGILGAGQLEVDMRPGGLNYGGVSQEGRQLIQPLVSGTRPDINEQGMEWKRNTIREAFLVDIFRMVSQKDARMATTEALLRNQEKGALLGPIMGRQQTELLGPIIEREIEILFRTNQLPPVPQELLDAGEGGLGFDIQYESPVSRLQLSEEQVGIDRVLQTAIGLAQFDNGVAISMLDTERILEHTQLGSGAPFDIIKSPEQIQQEQAAQAEAAQAAQLTEAAPAMAGAVKDLAQAQQISQGQ